MLPRCMGGSDTKDNLVMLFPEEHYVAHLLLVKIYPAHPGLVWAAAKMSQDSRTTQRTNKLYGWLKRRLSEIAKSRVGEKNGSFGSRWIHNEDTLEATRIDVDALLPEGWCIGRKPENKCATCGLKCKTSKYCPEHAAKARSITCRVNAIMSNAAGMVYINNGSVQKRQRKEDPIPPGFTLGGLPRNRTKV